MVKLNIVSGHDQVIIHEDELIKNLLVLEMSMIPPAPSQNYY